MTVVQFQARPPVWASAESLIDEARNGRMFILVDDEDRENEGDLVIPAQMATPDTINFMARHGRGLICLAITEDRARELQLELLPRSRGEGLGTAFTTSIEAREGVTTGISAADRACTIAAAIDGRRGAESIVSPGHIFPLIAKNGGVMVRAGHTEASVDVARLAGLNPSAVICEIMSDDGTMARRDDILAFATRHGLKVGTIRDLIAYRHCRDHLLDRSGALCFTSRWGGEWTAMTFKNRISDTEHLAIIKGTLNAGSPTLVRMHRMSHLTDVFGEESDRTHLLSTAMEMIATEGTGVIVLVNRPMSNGVFGRLLQSRAAGSVIEELPELAEVRDYGVGAQILSELGVTDIVLLTNSHHTMVALAGYGLNIVEQRAIVASPD